MLVIYSNNGQFICYYSILEDSFLYMFKKTTGKIKNYLFYYEISSLLKNFYSTRTQNVKVNKFGTY